MQSDTDFNFSAEPVKIPVTINGNPYVLREASEDAYTAYRNVSAKSIKHNEDGGAYFDGGQEADTLLLQRCLFEVLKNSSGDVEQPVKLDFVRGLPRRITKTLYLKLREMSGLDEESETVETLTKRIEKDTKRLARLKSAEAKGETPAKND